MRGEAKLAVKYVPVLLVNPVIVAVARSAPVGTAGVPVVARIDTARSGVVPLHPLQNRSRSMRFSGPLTDGMKLWPAQLVAVNPKPLVVTVVFC